MSNYTFFSSLKACTMEEKPCKEQFIKFLVATWNFNLPIMMQMAFEFQVTRGPFYYSVRGHIAASRELSWDKLKFHYTKLVCHSDSNSRIQNRYKSIVIRLLWFTRPPLSLECNLFQTTGKGLVWLGLQFGNAIKFTSIDGLWTLVDCGATKCGLIVCSAECMLAHTMSTLHSEAYLSIFVRLIISCLIEQERSLSSLWLPPLGWRKPFRHVPQ